MSVVPAHILFLIPSLEIGGAERKTIALANGFVQRGRDVRICTYRGDSGLLSQDLDPRVVVTNFGVGKAKYAVFSLIRYLIRVRPKFIVCVMHRAAMAGIVANIVTGSAAEAIILEGGVNLQPMKESDPKSYYVWKMQIYTFYRLAKRIIANGHMVAKDIIDHAHLPVRKIDVIYNPSAVAVLQDRGSNSQGAVEDWPATTGSVLISTCRLDQNKDVATIVRAFARVRSRRAATLILIGDGPERENLKALARSLGIDADVVFLGPRPRPWRYVARSALFLLASRYEGSSNALVEAMAVGCPIVATDALGDNGFILEQGRHGTLVPVGNDEAMAHAICTMLDNPTPADQLRRRAHDFGEKNIDHYLEQIESPRGDRPMALAGRREI